MPCPDSETDYIADPTPMAQTRKPGFTERFRALLNNGYLWKGLGVFVALITVVYLLFNYFLMPAYTRHGVSISVPDVLDYSYEDAANAVVAQGLRPEEVQLRKPDLPRNVVIDQNPSPNSRVKPGRRIYLTVNSGDTSTVVVPRVDGFSVREARNRIMIQGLAVENVFPDSIPSLHANTITRQEPRSGTRVPPGETVTLWYSTGLGDQQVLVPDITGRTVDDARQFLLLRRRPGIVDPLLGKTHRWPSPLLRPPVDVAPDVSALRCHRTHEGLWYLLARTLRQPPRTLHRAVA